MANEIRAATRVLLVGEGGVVFLNYNGRLTKRLEDDNSGVESFDISPNGQKIVWATKNASIFMQSMEKNRSFWIGRIQNGIRARSRSYMLGLIWWARGFPVSI